MKFFKIIYILSFLISYKGSTIENTDNTDNVEPVKLTIDDFSTECNEPVNINSIDYYIDDINTNTPVLTIKKPNNVASKITVKNLNF